MFFPDENPELGVAPASSGAKRIAAFAVAIAVSLTSFAAVSDAMAQPTLELPNRTNSQG